MKKSKLLRSPLRYSCGHREVTLLKSHDMNNTLEKSLTILNPSFKYKFNAISPGSACRNIRSYPHALASTWHDFTNNFPSPVPRYGGATSKLHKYGCNKSGGEEYNAFLLANTNGFNAFKGNNECMH